VKNIKHFFISLVAVLSSLASYSVSTYSDSLFSAYLKSDMSQWKQVIDDMHANDLNTSDVDFTAELVGYQYGYIAWMLGNDFEDEAEKYLDIAEENLEWLEEEKYDSSMTLSFRAAFYGFRIGINSWYVTMYGFKCGNSAEEAKRIDPNNPFAYVQLANVKYYQPEIMGGSKAKAMDYYLEAEKFYLKQNSSDLKNNWLYLNVLAMIAITYSEFEEYDKAKVYYEKMLVLQPNYGWIKYEKLPELVNKMKG
jgi:tetratricopeptide (TPR) repeat protein